MSTLPTSGKVSLAFLYALVCFTGCEKIQPIVTYTVPTKVPDQFREQSQRMLAAMVPDGDQVWFFKVMGPEDAVGLVAKEFRSFVQSIRIEDGVPQLSSLPEGWKRSGGNRPMRFASININTPSKQLDLSVSQLSRQLDWDQMVSSNVNRWRGQLSLEPSEKKWAGAEALKIESIEDAGILVDLLGKPGEGGASMMPPSRGSGRTASPSQDAQKTSPPRPPTPDPRLQFDRPEGWRDGRMNSFRMAAFNVGDGDAKAELTVIPAGGDVRGNVARWLGQLSTDEVSDETIDKALKEAIAVEVDGRTGQRFRLNLATESDSPMIDATIVPMSDEESKGMSLFIKMTGPYPTVAAQKTNISEFLASLKLK